MIQRRQTLWLLLSIICAALSFRFPFFVGTPKDIQSDNRVLVDFTAGSHFLILLLTLVVGILALIAIFMFKDRKAQTWLTLSALLIAGSIVVLYFLQMQKFEQSTLALWCILPIAAAGSLFMALRGIRNDEKLIKSLDKLRN